MNILRLFLLFLVGLFVRRLFTKSTRSSRDESAKSSSFTSAGDSKGPKNKNDSAITEQEIDDADFEEIP